MCLDPRAPRFEVSLFRESESVETCSTAWKAVSRTLNAVLGLEPCRLVVGPGGLHSDPVRLYLGP